jgi:hypothetical protein
MISHGSRLLLLEEHLADCPDKKVPSKTTIHRPLFLEGTKLLWNAIRIFCNISFLCWKKIERKSGFSLRCDCLHCGHNCIAARVLWQADCWAWLLATAISRHYQASLLSVGTSLRKSYSKNIRSLEEKKYVTEQTVANTEPETRGKVARKTLKRRFLSYAKWWTFSASSVELFLSSL